MTCGSNKRLQEKLEYILNRNDSIICQNLWYTSYPVLKKIIASNIYISK